jgi:hypothetical protein
MHMNPPGRFQGDFLRADEVAPYPEGVVFERFIVENSMGWNANQMRTDEISGDTPISGESVSA